MDVTKPIETLRLGGLSLAIWRNTAKDGVWYNATLERRYYDEAAREWKSTHSYGRDDLLPMSKLLERAFTRIHELQASDREQDRQAAEPPSSQTKAAAKPARSR
ncbi:MAG: hypothetical protein AAGB48_13005 [Planctomycetota bacterium]